MAVNVDEGITENLSTDVNIPEDHEGSESGSTVSFDVGEKFLSYAFHYSSVTSNCACAE